MAGADSLESFDRHFWEFERGFGGDLNDFKSRLVRVSNDSTSTRVEDYFCTPFLLTNRPKL